MVKQRRLKLVLASMLMAAAGSASAQYKWIDADGRVGYGDMIPPGNVKVLQGPKGFKKEPAKTSSANNGNLDLPVQLRKITERFPVLVYTTTDCAPCDLARQHLKRRGVPYQEKTISTGQDLQAFNDRGFTPDTRLPLIVVGADKQVGYHALLWDRLLTSSGYPKKSRLPSNFEFAQAEALASVGQQPNAGEGPVNSGGGFQRGNVLTDNRGNPSGREAQEETPRIRF